MTKLTVITEEREDKTFQVRIERDMDLICSFYSMPDETREDFKARIKSDILETLAEYL